VTAVAPVPPQNLEAEEHVLGSVLLSPRVLGDVSEIVSPGDFYSHRHGALFRALIDMDAADVPIDTITVADYLDEHGLLDDVGGKSRVVEIASVVPASANATHYARIVRELSGLRGLIRAGQEIARLGWERPGELENLNDRAEQAVFQVTQEHYRGDLELLTRAASRAYDRVARLAESDGTVIGLGTGFPAVDRILGGIEPGNLVILAARPSMGKSAFALSIIAKLAIREHRPVAMFSLEMSEDELAMRLQSSGSLIPLERLRRGEVRPDEWDRLRTATTAIERAPIHVDDSSDVTLAELRSKSRRLKMRVPDLSLVIVDYLQLMSSEGENRNQQISALSRGLKVLARQLEVPVLCLAQLNRQLEQRPDKRPMLSDLRDSGAIEQDADIVCFLFREDYYRKRGEPPNNVAEVIVAKHRMGPTDTARLHFHAGQAKFQEHAA
jgi:replicative DNA helicase